MRTQNENTKTIAHLQAAILAHLTSCTTSTPSLVGYVEATEAALELAGELDGLVIEAAVNVQGRHEVGALLSAVLHAVDFARMSHERLCNAVTNRTREHLFAQARE